MPDHSLFDSLEQSFPKLNKEDWSRAASQEIQGKNPQETLTWNSQDEIKFLPYYDLQDNKSLHYLQNFELAPASNSHTGSRSWDCLPKISVTHVEASNTVALNHLANGADGILFDLGPSDSINLDKLLADIDWPYCNVSFLVTHPEKLSQSIQEYVVKKNYDPGLLAGTLFCNSVPADILAYLKSFNAFTKFRSLGVYVPSGSPVKEISNALLQAATLMDKLGDDRAEKEFAWRNMSFSLAAGTDFFSDITKPKVARLLLYQVARAYELQEYREVEIHVRLEPWVNEKFQPHSNMLRSTCAALAAVVGGCNSLTIAPEDENNSTMNRIARNVSNILREEAYLNKVSDPIAGAYAIENMVDSFAQAAWKDFQHNVRQV